MMRFELSAGTSNKFWEIELAGKKFTARWGRIGTTGQEKTQTWPSPGVAQREHDKLVAEKRKKGYVEIAAKKPPPPAIVHPRNAALESAIRADRTDAGAYGVYADWLQANGSPIGELIILEQALAKKKDPAKQKRATAIKKQLGLPQKDLAQFGWRSGMWQWLRLENTVDWMDSEFDARGLANPLFASPLCAALEELRLGILRWDENAEDVPALIEAAGKHAWAGELVRLHLGDLERDVDMAHQCVGRVGKAIAKSFPRLRTLKVHSGGSSFETSQELDFAGLALPALTSLVVETCAMTKKRLKQLFAASLPKLDTLELWFGDDESDVKCKDLAPLLDGKVFPHVTKLGLRNANFTDPLCAALVTSKIAHRLEALDLSMGVMSDAGATALIGGTGAFPKLRELSIRESFVSPATIRAVKAAFPGVTVDAKEQKDVDDSIEDEIYRYVSVGE